MHFLPNTEDEDAAAEVYWPEDFKQVIRTGLRQVLAAKLNGQGLRHVYNQKYREAYSDFSQFMDRIADIIVIGAENGADDAFDEMYTAFLTESPLPEVRRYSRYLWPQAFPQRVKRELHRAIVDEYSQDSTYNYAYKVGYAKDYPNFGEFITEVARLVVTGVVNGADNMLEELYRAFAILDSLPPARRPARRRPRRLKAW